MTASAMVRFEGLDGDQLVIYNAPANVMVVQPIHGGGSLENDSVVVLTGLWDSNGMAAVISVANIARRFPGTKFYVVPYSDIEQVRELHPRIAAESPMPYIAFIDPMGGVHWYDKSFTDAAMLLQFMENSLRSGGLALK